MIDYTQGRKDVCYLRKNFEVKTIETSEKPKEEVFDAESVNERLGNGDLEALEELEKHKITYQLEENANGYKVKYSYEGTNYTIVCYGKSNASGGNNNTDDSKDDGHTLLDSYLNRFTGTITINPEWNDDINYESKYPSVGAPDTGAPVNPPVEDSVEEPEANPPVNPPVDEPVDTPEEDSYRFDYEAAGVDKDARIDDFLSDDTLLNAKISFYVIGDGPDYDPLLKELDKMRPQLLEYIKNSLEAQGREFDSDVAEKIIDMAISGAAQNGVAMWNYNNTETFEIAYISNLLQNSSNSEPQEFILTIEDLVNDVKAHIDRALGYKDDNNFMDMLNTLPVSDSDENNTISYKLPFSLPAKDYEEFIYTDQYLLYTDDYFLTPEEQKLKDCMQYVKHDSGVVFNPRDLDGYIDAYAQHIKRVLYARYENILTEDEIAEIVSKAAGEVKQNRISDQEIGGQGRTMYPIGDNLIKFEELCEKYAHDAWEQK